MSHLTQGSIGPLKASLDSLRRLIGVLDGRLQKVDWKLGMNFGGDPGPVLVADAFVGLQLK